MNSFIQKSWVKIAPFWSLKNLIAINPLKGFEDLPFEKALQEAQIYFQQKDLPAGMHNINRETIKWIQAFLDEGQSKINMPLRSHGFLKSVIILISFDSTIHQKNKKNIQWLENLPKNPSDIINECLTKLNIQKTHHELFSTLLLTTLPGWASYIKYLTEWTEKKLITQEEYLAFRLILTSLIWPDAQELLEWHNKAQQEVNTQKIYNDICDKEIHYQKNLLNQLNKQSDQKQTKPDTQFVFCIDVRSEPFRRKLETIKTYETFGCAGFFGIPVTIKNKATGKEYASCPVLIKPEYTVDINSINIKRHTSYNRFQLLKKMYQSAKYTFTTPLTLVETVGILSGLSILFKTFSPQLVTLLRETFKTKINNNQFVPSIESIPFEKQVKYATQILNIMGFTNNFSPLVILCGHKSNTENNAYQTSLDCGACAGHSGDPNAQILATILNKTEIRKALEKEGITIPIETFFIAAEHNTTTDELVLFDQNIPAELEEHVQGIKINLANITNKPGITKAKDWAEVRPEWGLSKNASFIVGPRSITKNINLNGRAFLHSYDYKKDPKQVFLRQILTAPVIVAQWINAQYLFSTLDNVAFGAGSKVTKNITGKIGIMQGNASDLMTGLPLQSVYKTDTQKYHEPLRLTVFIHAPQEYIDTVLDTEPELKKLVDNKWIHVISLDQKNK